MSRITRIAIGAAVVTLLAAFAAQAQVTVFGGDHAQDCYRAAKYGANQNQGMRDCTTAIETEPLDRHDLAGTYVNRGVLYMNLKAFTLAQQDFESALALEPNLGDAHLNRGAALIGERRYAEGIDEITKGLAFGSQEPAKGYYNRALAYEAMDNEQAAYFDYLKASELAPTWPAPRNELKRFTVRPVAKGPN
jgi:tetratricopeptide (TPR) repeat protein